MGGTERVKDDDLKKLTAFQENRGYTYPSNYNSRKVPPKNTGKNNRD